MKMLLIVVGVVALTLSEAFKLQTPHKSLRSKQRKLSAVPEWLTEENVNEEMSENTLTVRFINTISGKDVVVNGVKEGSNLLFIGDSAGVKLPRACRTGLCGSCTCEVKDPAAIATATNPRDGFATLRACSTKCYIPEGLDEMVVDVRRMKGTTTIKSGKGGVDVEVIETAANPLERFAGDWELEFKPKWELAREMGSGINVKAGQKACPSCSGTGRVMCYACLGGGSVKMENGNFCQCATCVGSQTVGCGYCNASGVQAKKTKKL